MNVLKENFKGVYLFSLVNVLSSAFGFFLVSSAFGEFYTGIVYLVISVVIYTGFQWYILNVFRNNENGQILKTIIKNSGWIVILSVVKNIVRYMLLIVLVIIVSFLWGGEKQIGIIENILEICIAGMITALFAFTEFIYYDKKDRGPLRAVFDSITTTRKVYGKVLLIYLFIILYDVIMSIYSEVANENFIAGNILMIFAFVWMFAVYPICYFKLCKIYDSVKKEESEINDSLEVVARTLDDEMNKN